MAKRIQTSKIRCAMWAMGMPTQGDQFANVYRALIKAGLDERQATALLREAYNAAKGYTFNLTDGTMIQRATRLRNAAEMPRSKDAEDLAAEREGRPSRWGTAEFHRAV